MEKNKAFFHIKINNLIKEYIVIRDPMEEEVKKYYERAFKISDKVIEFSKSIIKEDMLIREIAERIEEEIRKLGGEPAFPVNICINDVAAHYSPDSTDETVVKKEDLVKIDIGIHVNGYVCDRAFTICLSQRNHPLIKASEEALKEALKSIRPGAKVFEISEIVENTLKEFGFNPIRNLCGHGLERYKVHARPTIPNGKNNIKEEIKEGDVIAMEVFSTNGGGWVKESETTLIYSFNQDRPIRIWEGRKILEMAKVKFNSLPFAKRWLKEIPRGKLELALRELVEVEALRSYPVLREETHGLVAQSEETIIVE